MAMNKFIHPRNIYKTHPDFKALRSEFPEFRDICTVDDTGKTSVNFQDEKTLAILTQCLLKKDFDLQVEFPVNRLIPTLPLRLNYILWIEDILNAFGIKNASGIDIGCGASCIYPLLGAKKNLWSMTGLEVDQTSVESARRNVANNGLEHKITVLHQPPDSGLFDLLLDGNSKTFDFCLCNPPFYDDSSSGEPQNRTGNRPAPRNAKTGSRGELSCDGGEVNFIRKIFTASFKYRSRIRVFTTMIGIKNDLSVLGKELRRLGVTNWVETEFCQGRTTRWGLAWSFSAQEAGEMFYLRTVPCTRSTFVKEPAIFFVPEGDRAEVPQKGQRIEEALLRLLAELEIEASPLPEQLANERRWRLRVHKVTWTNARTKRRREEQQQQQQQQQGMEEFPPAKRPRLAVELSPILVADLYLNTVANGHTLQIFYLDGVQGKDACQQILQFIINRFNKLF